MFTKEMDVPEPFFSLNNNNIKGEQLWKKELKY